MRTGLILLWSGYFASFALAADNSAARTAREELERELASLVSTAAPRAEIVYLAPERLGYSLLEAGFTLDGVELPTPALAELNQSGPHLLFSGEVKPGPHQLVSRLVFVESSSTVFTYMAGYRWKLKAQTSFHAQNGLEVEVGATAVKVSARESNERLKISYQLRATMAAPRQEIPVSVVDPDLPPILLPLAAAPDAGSPVEVRVATVVPVVQPSEPKPLVPPKPGALLVTVTARNKPTPATVRLFGEAAPPGAGKRARLGPVKLAIPAGRHVIEVLAPKLLAQAKAVELAEDSQMPVEFALLSAPKRPLVAITLDQLKLAKPLRFVVGTTQLTPEGPGLLAHLVDAVIRHGLKRVRIEVHTDNQGDPQALLALSEQQAQTLVQLLREAGLEGNRIEARGLGASQPKSPNLTARNRELNRRVEWVILGR
jgi:outer membrane protein OmpA-like peptidoglycan-associated protein